MIAVEDVAGTDALLERVAAYRRDGRFGKAGGVLVKCLKPMQDGRHDLPTIGADTAERAAARGPCRRRRGCRPHHARRPRGDDRGVPKKPGVFLLGLKPPG